MISLRYALAVFENAVQGREAIQATLLIEGESMKRENERSGFEGEGIVRKFTLGKGDVAV